MKLASHHKLADGSYVLVVEVADDDEREFKFMAKPSNVSENEWVSMQRREVKLLLEAEKEKAEPKLIAESEPL